MKAEPLLGTVTGAFAGRSRCRLNAHGGLHQLGNNPLPYFSLTGEVLSGGSVVACGALHDDILKKFPRLRRLERLHMADIYGVPMHAAENGFYHMAGAVPGNFGQRYHAGNSERHFPVTPPPEKPWQTTEHRRPTAAECLIICAEHLRVTVEELEPVRVRCIAAYNAVAGPGDSLASLNGAAEPTEHAEAAAAAKAELSAYVQTLLPRWRAEADECIALLRLRVYGGDWKGPRTHQALKNRRAHEGRRLRPHETAAVLRRLKLRPRDLSIGEIEQALNREWPGRVYHSYERGGFMLRAALKAAA